MVIKKVENDDKKEENKKIEENKKNRSSNFELLRILLILMIIILHYCNARMGGVLQNVKESTANYYFIHFVESACIVAVNVFILITGYFMNNKKEIKLNKVIHLFYLTAIWGIIIFIGIVIFKKPEINLNYIFKFIYTITERWFVLIYCILYLLIPYINKFIHSINKKQFEILLVILVICFYVWPTIFLNTVMLDRGYGMTNFIVLYFIGAYIKLYYDNFKSFSKSTMLYIACTIITTIISLVSSDKAWQYNSIFNLIGSVALFEIFKAINIKNIKVINLLATYTFSTYIIHENQLISASLYNNLFKTNEYYNSKWLCVNLLITTIGIYIICIVAEKVRRLIMNKYIDSKIEKINYNIKL